MGLRFIHSLPRSFVYVFIPCVQLFIRPLFLTLSLSDFNVGSNQYEGQALCSILLTIKEKEEEEEEEEEET